MDYLKSDVLIVYETMEGRNLCSHYVHVAVCKRGSYLLQPVLQYVCIAALHDNWDTYVAIRRLKYHGMK